MNKKLSLLILVALAFSLGILSCDKDDDPDGPTALEITVYDGSELVQGATVKIFDNDVDWSNSKNALYVDSTNSNGKVTFSDIEPIKYYIEVLKGDKNNWFGTWATDGAIQAKETTKLDIYIE